jgi:hypothetical protein
MDLSRSNDSNRRFNRLTCIDSGLFFFCSLFLIIFLFYSLMLGWLEIEFYNFLYLLFMKLS